MADTLTIDSSIIVASLLDHEKDHIKSQRLWNEVISGKLAAIMPYTVLIEVVAAVRRRTGNKDLAQQVKEELLSMDSLHFVIVDPESASDAADIAIQSGMRGMDAIVVQTAKEYNTKLVSLDKEMIEKAAAFVKIRKL
jgi:predicted nucleic acid-binding protein